MTTYQRILTILQLCIAFSLVLWYAAQPFMGEYFTLKSHMLLYEFVTEKNADLFNSIEERELISKDYQVIKDYSQRSPLKKMIDGIRVLMIQIPPFQLAWMVFTSIIGVLLLLGKPGARQAAWILPLIALAYAVDNRTTGKDAYQSPDSVLFPTEQVILQEPLSKNIALQREQLQKGWENYLVANWGSDLKSAEFNFTVARLVKLHHQPMASWLNSFHEKSSYWILLIYIMWNLYFAMAVSRNLKFS